jgi:hypothetical protein
MEDINEEKVKLKITILTEEILLEGETLKEGDILDWSNFIALLEKEKFNIIKEEDGNYFRLLVKDQ